MSKQNRAVHATAWIVLGIGLGLVTTEHRETIWAQVQGNEEITFSAEYLEVSEDEMMQKADAIFVGRVLHISETLWNQDSGLPWNADDGGRGTTALPLHEVELEVEKTLADQIGLGKKTVLTVLGNSPWALSDEAHHGLLPGDRAVIFARAADLAWRETGTRPVLQLVGVPSQAHLVEEGQGLFYRQGQPENPRTLDELEPRIHHLRGLASEE